MLGEEVAVEDVAASLCRRRREPHNGVPITYTKVAQLESRECRYINSRLLEFGGVQPHELLSRGWCFGDQIASESQPRQASERRKPNLACQSVRARDICPSLLFLRHSRFTERNCLPCICIVVVKVLRVPESFDFA
jgi:hypothetical protein